MSDLSQLTAGNWVIEPAHTEIGFSVRHLGLSKVRGRFNSFSGSANLDPANPGLTTLNAEIDLSSVDTNNAYRDNHLKTTDFFDTAAHPTMTFTSTSVTQTKVAGNLTINGVTKPVTLDLEFHGVAVDGYSTTRAGFSATTQIKRSDYGIDFNAPLGIDGMLIGDKVDIELEVQLVPAS